LTRIRCSVIRYMSQRLFPFVSFTLSAPGIYKIINALIDTGSPFTVISPRDLLATRYPFRAKRTDQIVFLAGHKFYRTQINRAKLLFKTENDKIFDINVRSIGALIPTKHDQKTIDAIISIPSLVGNDFLEDHNCSLHFNPNNQTADLEC